jgi:dTDP-4-dehydrorhamnose reductase
VRVLVLGASGIIGQHMRESIPPGVAASFSRREPTPGYLSADASDYTQLNAVFRQAKPKVIVNLAGESRPDVVERDPHQFNRINVALPLALAEVCCSLDARLIHVSTQAVFSGREAPYSAFDERAPVNAYGDQKKRAEDMVLSYADSTVIRPTFVLGVRPDPSIGRANPMELLLSGNQTQQVSDRWFSPAFAPDVAGVIWEAVLRRPRRRVIHAGVPVRVSRYDIARDLGLAVEPVSHDSFPGLAPRPIDTSYARGAQHYMTYHAGLLDCQRRFQTRKAA